MAKDRSDVLQGTLDLMVLKALDAMGAMHAGRSTRARSVPRASQSGSL
jgi:hypothetical protein